jgi:hypothetical protein
MRDINHMTAGKTTFGVNQAAKLKQAQQIASSLNNLANATIQKNTTIENLVVTNTTLTKAITNIQLFIAQMCVASVPTSPTPAAPAPMTEAHFRPSHWSNTKSAWDKAGYCWTHGYKVKVGHFSTTCSLCKTGHQPSATRANIMGGSTYNIGYPTPTTPSTWQGTPVDLHSITTTSLVNSTVTRNLNKPFCANPVQLEHTAFIDTAASIPLLTKTTPAVSTTKPSVQISIVQPGGDCMTTTHTVNLLLSNLPPEARLVHWLSGLVNNLLSVAILCNTGCKVFFHKTSCEVTLDGKTILQGWRDPKNCLWHVMIVNNGWTTQLTIRDVARPTLPLSTTPTGHLANSMPIVPFESNMT